MDINRHSSMLLTSFSRSRLGRRPHALSNSKYYAIRTKVTDPTLSVSEFSLSLVVRQVCVFLLSKSSTVLGVTHSLRITVLSSFLHHLYKPGRRKRYSPTQKTHHRNRNPFNIQSQSQRPRPHLECQLTLCTVLSLGSQARASQQSQRCPISNALKRDSQHLLRIKQIQTHNPHRHVCGRTSLIRASGLSVSGNFALLISLIF
jgi:hypothetical protein